MTKGSVLENARAVRPRYVLADKKEKGQILDQFELVISYQRRAAIRMISKKLKTPADRRGHPSQYKAVAAPLKAIWEASDRLCSKRLQPFMPQMVAALREHGEQHIEATVAAELCRMSPATIDRLLIPYRRIGGRRGFSTTRPGSLLKASIPIRTFADWQENKGKHPDGYQYTQFCEYYHRWRGLLDYLHVPGAPGRRKGIRRLLRWPGYRRLHELVLEPQPVFFC